MKVDIVKVGSLMCNCYILDIDNFVLVIDPGDEYEKIKNKLDNKKVLGVLITHHHFDHVGALDKILEDYKVKVYDINNLLEQDYEIGPFKFQVIYTKGHSNDSLTYYFKEDKCMFVGDFIFLDSVGRVDLEGGSKVEMKNSLDKIKKYDDNTIVYPGHGLSTTLGYEKKNNLYFREGDLW